MLGSMGVEDVVSSLATLLHCFRDQISSFIDPLLFHLVCARLCARVCIRRVCMRARWSLTTIPPAATYARRLTASGCSRK